MLQLRVFGAPGAMSDVADCLEGIPGARPVVSSGDNGARGALVTADLVDDAVDGALQQVRRLGVPAEDVVLVARTRSVSKHPRARLRPWFGPTCSARPA